MLRCNQYTSNEKWVEHTPGVGIAIHAEGDDFLKICCLWSAKRRTLNSSYREAKTRDCEPAARKELRLSRLPTSWAWPRKTGLNVIGLTWFLGWDTQSALPWVRMVWFNVLKLWLPCMLPLHTRCRFQNNCQYWVLTAVSNPSAHCISYAFESYVKDMTF